MKPFTYHTHSVFCDGKDSLDELARAAYLQGLDSLGLSCHSYVPSDIDFCIKPDAVDEFKNNVRRIEKEYARLGLDVFLGVEQDVFTLPKGRPEGYDYVIGSIHSLLVGDDYVTVDSKSCFFENLDKYFNGDAVAMALDYYKAAEQIPEITGCDIVGHIDIVTKFNEGGCLFNERDKRYELAAQSAIEKLARSGAIFEINTGAMSRGYRTEPYPSRRLLSMIREVNGLVTYSSDCHDANYLIHGFDMAQTMAREAGFDSFMKLRRIDGKCEFYPEEIEV